MIKSFSFITLLLLLSGCLKQGSVKDTATQKQCHIVFDAGSSGTRLYIYLLDNQDITTIVGSKTKKPLAQPIRVPSKNTQGKFIYDYTQSIDPLLTLLDTIKTNEAASFDKNNKEITLENGFDWSNKSSCPAIKSIRVYATGGMRIAEQLNAEKTNVLWGSLRKALQAKIKTATNIDKNFQINMRTITGFEEGLYAWLAIKHIKQVNLDDASKLGVVEMGGASTQIAFPCPNCKNNATYNIKIEDKNINFYSYSFLGLGQDEAYQDKFLGFPATCKYGAGFNTKTKWKKSHCSKQLDFVNSGEIKDPYNYSMSTLGTSHKVPNKDNIDNWLFTGAFYYNKVNGKNKKGDVLISDIQNCCVNKNEKACFHNKEHSCFRAVTISKYLTGLGLGSVFNNINTIQSSWAIGAVICDTTDCLKGQNICHRWLKNDKNCL